MKNIEKRKETIWKAAFSSLSKKDELVDELARHGFFHVVKKKPEKHDQIDFHCCHCSRSFFIYSTFPRTVNLEYIQKILRDDRQRNLHKPNCLFNPRRIMRENRKNQEQTTQLNTANPQAIVTTKDGALCRVYTLEGRYEATNAIDAPFLKSEILIPLSEQGLYCSSYNKNTHACEFVCCSCSKTTIRNASTEQLQQAIYHDLNNNPERFHSAECTFNNFELEDEKANLSQSVNVAQPENVARTVNLPQPVNEDAAAAQNRPNCIKSHIPDGAMPFLKCHFCMEKPLNFVAFKPCFHVCLCKDCTTNLFDQHHPLCPICYTEIEGIKRIYIYTES